MRAAQATSTFQMMTRKEKDTSTGFPALRLTFSARACRGELEVSVGPAACPVLSKHRGLMRLLPKQRIWSEPCRGTRDGEGELDGAAWKSLSSPQLLGPSS